MKLHQPLGSEAFAPVFLRVAIGTYLLMAGFLKLDNLGTFVGEIKELAILPAQFATVYGIMLPYMEIFAGALLILGLWTILGAFLAAIHFTTLVYVFGIFTSSGDLLNKDLILLAGALSILYSGAGALSFDRFKQTG